jgi:hypothetical protein
MSDSPQRIQLRRMKDWRKPKGAIVVARPSKWGNPFLVGTPANGGNLTRTMAVEHFREALLDGRIQFTATAVRRDLAGHDLACWCPLDQPCHADVLLEFANPEDRP